MVSAIFQILLRPQKILEVRFNIHPYKMATKGCIFFLLNILCCHDRVYFHLHKKSKIQIIIFNY